MTQPGQHVLIIGERSAYQSITEFVMARSGRQVTLATSYDEAVAVLRSSLHPLVVHTNTNVIIPGEEYCSMLLKLLANPDFAATHAFVVSSGRSGDRLAALSARVAQTNAAHVYWLCMPFNTSALIAAQEAAEVWLRSRP